MSKPADAKAEADALELALGMNERIAEMQGGKPFPDEVIRLLVRLTNAQCRADDDDQDVISTMLIGRMFFRLPIEAMREIADYVEELCPANPPETDPK